MRKRIQRVITNQQGEIEIWLMDNLESKHGEDQKTLGCHWCHQVSSILPFCQLSCQKKKFNSLCEKVQDEEE